MSKLLGTALRSARQQKGLSQEKVADTLAVSRVAVSQWESGKTSPSTENLVKICSLLDLNIAAATSGMVKVEAFTPLGKPEGDPGDLVRVVRDRRPEHREINDEFIRFLDGSPVDPVRPRDVPVYSSAYSTVGDADFYRSDEIIDFVRRPQSYSPSGKAGSVYALYVVSPVLAPRYEEGELFYVQPGRPAVPGDYAVIKLKGGEADQQRWKMRKLLGREGGGWKVLSFKPTEEILLANDDIETIHRIVPWGELVDR